MTDFERLPDEINLEQIKASGIEGICYQLTTRGTWPFNASFNSTSFFINKNFLLTSAHNLAKTYRNVNKIEISPSRIGNMYHLGTYLLFLDKQEYFKIFPEYNMNNKPSRKLYDLALIYIPDEILETNPHLSDIKALSILDDISSLSDGEKIYCAGYPASGKHKGRYRMTMDTSKIKDIKEHVFSHTLDTMTGNSGSPIMVKRNDKMYVIGINSIKFNGTLINDQKKSWIKESMQKLETQPV